MNSEEIVDHLIVDGMEVGKRIDQVLASRFVGRFSRTYFQRLLGEGSIEVNGVAAKKRALLALNDEITICWSLTPDLALQKEDIPLHLLYEDADLLIVNKPAGMVVHPAPGHFSGTFANALLFHCDQLAGAAGVRPGIVHRLDKDTTGVLIGAKTQAMQYRLSDLFRERQVDKEYFAVCVGVPPEGDVHAPIGRDPTFRQRMAVCERGKTARSHVAVVAARGALSLVRVNLYTGRTHQIRVHLKFLGTPILGDPLYGSVGQNQKHRVDRQLLHARSVAFLHPSTQEKIQVLAPLPEDFMRWYTYFGEPQM